MTASLDPARPQERSRLAWRRTALAVGSLALIVVRLVAARHTGGAIVLGAIVIAMLNAPYVIGSYVVTFAAIGLYTWRMLGQARKAARQVPPEDRPWT